MLDLTMLSSVNCLCRDRSAVVIKETKIEDDKEGIDNLYNNCRVLLCVVSSCRSHANQSTQKDKTTRMLCWSQVADKLL